MVLVFQALQFESHLRSPAKGAQRCSEQRDFGHDWDIIF
uniref:Uncharacterized protein n=1 Tax=Rhizophora mucronata TaxID=61149 RepID=A0A2P2Q8E8_RHIMU